MDIKGIVEGNVKNWKLEYGRADELFYWQLPPEEWNLIAEGLNSKEGILGSLDIREHIFPEGDYMLRLKATNIYGEEFTDFIYLTILNAAQLPGFPLDLLDICPHPFPIYTPFFATPTVHSLVYDVDKDKKPEIIVGDIDVNRVYIINEDGSFQYLETPAPTRVAIDDLDGDQSPELVVIGWGNEILKVWSFREGEWIEKWSKQINNGLSFAGYNYPPLVIADLDGDGKKEIITIYRHRIDFSDGSHLIKEFLLILNSKGEEIYRQYIGETEFDNRVIIESIVVGDVLSNRRGKEIIAGDYSGYVRIISSQDFHTEDTYKISAPVGGLILADLDSGRPEVIVTQQADFDKDIPPQIIILGLDKDNKFIVKNVRSLDKNTYIIPASVGDINNDGKPEIFTATTHFASNYIEDDDRVKIYGFDGRLRLLRNWPQKLEGVFMSGSQIILADANGDKYPEIMVSVGGRKRGIHIFNRDGEEIMSKRTFSICGVTPAVADLNQDGKLEIIEIGSDWKLFVWKTEGLSSCVEWGMYQNNPQHTGVYKRKRKPQITPILELLLLSNISSFGTSSSSILQMKKEEIKNLLESIRRSYDFRSKDADEELTEEVIEVWAKGLVKFQRGLLDKDKLVCVIGYDIRHSSERISAKLIDTLLNLGIDVIDIGLVTTPILYFATLYFDADLGVMITASHNPPQENGFKPVIKDKEGQRNPTTPEIRKITEFAKKILDTQEFVG
ncbi:MAG TPA: hypothetical protein ENI44_00760, partial [Thermoplasmatales archaeon]|nr:hypothetical protein [Thermoplasmatales archaeon]